MLSTVLWLATLFIAADLYRRIRRLRRVTMVSEIQVTILWNVLRARGLMTVEDIHSARAGIEKVLWSGDYEHIKRECLKIGVDIEKV